MADRLLWGSMLERSLLFQAAGVHQKTQRILGIFGFNGMVRLFIFSNQIAPQLQQSGHGVVFIIAHSVE